MEPEKRKHARVTHQGSVEFAAANRTIHGTSLNISRNGMQVVVNLPESYEAIRSITFQLPATGEKLRIPCRLVRTSRNSDQEEQTLGIEFQHEAEAQLLLIEKFIQDEASRTLESRQLPRTDCRIESVHIERPGVQAISVDNISAEGLLFSFTGSLEPQETVSLELHLPEDDRPLRLRGTIVYVIDRAFRGNRTAGLRFLSLKETEASRLRNLILSTSAGSVIRNLYGHFRSKPSDSEYCIRAQGEILDLVMKLQERGIPLNVLLEGHFTILEGRLSSVNPEGTFLLSVPGLKELQTDVTPENSYFTFLLNDASHYFKTEFVGVRELRFSIPSAIFRSDKRSYRRKSLELGSAVTLVVGSPDQGQKEFSGTLVDISRRGFLCKLDVPPEEEKHFLEGGTLHYRLADSLGLHDFGQIRHVRSETYMNGNRLHMGIEAGIAREPPRKQTVENVELNDVKLPPNTAGFKAETKVVQYANASGSRICALLNATKFHVRAPVVIIPPSYGKKKESFAPLAATLLDNFQARGQDLVVLRYDGVNRPGESQQEVSNPRRGYEMLSYRASQGQEDLQAALSYIRDNPFFTPQSTILITFSMAALDARKALSSTRGRGIDLWISCMGVPAAQSTLRNSLGGIDIVSNFSMGIPNGIMGLLGHLINMDIMAKDLVEHKYAYLTDARFDMSRIDTPVLWICGEHDKWVELAEVEDIMSVRANGARDIMVLPAGHNLRTSTDAIRAFKLITSFLFEFLHAQRIQPFDPGKEDLVRLLAAERDRLSGKSDVSLEDYWREYLLGNERNNAGYDFYQNIEEFNSFLGKQVELLELESAESIADLGCGTGLFLESLLQNAAKSRENRIEYDITAIDLVPQALVKARAKCDQILSANPNLHVRIDFVHADLEPNRLIPVSLFAEKENLGLEFLRNKVEGLTNATIDRLLQYDGCEVLSMMRGAEPDDIILAPLREFLPSHDMQAVLDFNAAARFLKNSTSAGRIPAGKILQFRGIDRDFGLDLPRSKYTKVVASLLISYLFNPEFLLTECYRILRPGGLLLVSSMKPDSDISILFTNYIHSLRNAPSDGKNHLSGALAMLNEAASLFELEEDGLFRFFSSEELGEMLLQAGFRDISIYPAMGTPPQALIATGRKA